MRNFKVTILLLLLVVFLVIFVISFFYFQRKNSFTNQANLQSNTSTRQTHAYIDEVTKDKDGFLLKAREIDWVNCEECGSGFRLENEKPQQTYRIDPRSKGLTTYDTMTVNDAGEFGEYILPWDKVVTVWADFYEKDQFRADGVTNTYRSAQNIPIGAQLRGKEGLYKIVLEKQKTGAAQEEVIHSVTFVYTP